MQPETPREFLKVAIQRLDAAQSILRELDLPIEAFSLGGYAVECSLKAVILEHTPRHLREELLAKLTRGAKVHRPEVLLDRLRDLGVRPPIDLTKRLKRFDWNTDHRDELGRGDAGETRGMLRTAEVVCQWAKEQIK